jgi:Mg2+ and Co2+ transporter CorA
MKWRDLADPCGSQLDELAVSYSLHSLHVEDARCSGQRTKAESGEQYIFIILKILDLESNNQLTSGNLILFVGAAFLITVHTGAAPVLNRCPNGPIICVPIRCSISCWMA